MLNNYAIVDNSDYAHFIGADEDGIGNMVDFFQGFIYSLCIYGTTKTEFPDFDNSATCGDFQCENCPAGPVCLIECNFDQRFDQGLCEDCLEECIYGCKTGDNCNVCSDTLCEDCSGSTADEVVCITCVPNAEYNEDTETCECLPDYTYLSEYHSCSLTCHPNCIVCDGTSDEDCSECDSGFYKQPGSSICKGTCPSGSIKNDDDNTCDLIEDYQACIVFDKDRYSRIADGDSAITAYGGSTQFNQEIEPDDPKPIYLRGNYFDGVDDFMEVAGILVAPTHTI